MTFKIGDRVNVTALGEVGRIEGGKGDAWEVKLSNDLTQTFKNAQLSEPDIQKNMSDGGMDNVLEVGYNAVAYAIVQKIRKSPAFGSRFQSFVISDAVYELIGKFYLEPYVPFIRPDEIKDNEASDMFQAGDFRDALKALPIVALQAVVQKMMYKKALGTDMIRNAVDGYISIALANAAGRLTTRQMSGAKPYRW
jgi:hypothetical protein